MYRIKTFNKIAPQGLERLDPADRKSTRLNSSHIH